MRVSTRPALERILAIDSAVRRRDWPNARTLARELEVVRRTIQRDIEFMRDRLHAPLEFDIVHNGYFYTDASYRLCYLPVTEGELVALLVSAHVMDLYRGTPFERDLRKAMAKVARSLPDTIEVSLDELTNYLSVLPRVRTTYDPEIFRVLVRAVCHSRQLSMVYWTAGRNETQRRTVDPYDLVLAPDDDWCLIGHCHLRNDIRLFKVQRVRSAVETGACFLRPAGFRARDYMAETCRYDPGRRRLPGRAEIHPGLRRNHPRGGDGDLDDPHTWSRFTGDRARPSGSHRSEPSSG